MLFLYLMNILQGLRNLEGLFMNFIKYLQGFVNLAGKRKINLEKSSSNKPHLLRNWLLHYALVLRHENVLQ